MKKIPNYHNEFLLNCKKVNTIEILLVKLKFLFKLLSLKVDQILYNRNTKTVENVKIDYNLVWNNPDYFPKTSLNIKKHYIYYNGKYFKKKPWSERKYYFETLKDVIDKQKPKKILEVGCGNGMLINTLARVYSNISFSGIDLTRSGVEASKLLTDNDNYNEKVGNFFYNFSKQNLVDNINFKNLSVVELPDDEKYDFTYTTLALEQMKTVQQEAIRKITHVTNKTIVLIEPFYFENQSFISKKYLKLKNYFTLTKEDIEINGFKITNCIHMPSKFYRPVTAIILHRD